MLTRTAVKADTTGGISKTATNRSPSSFFRPSDSMRKRVWLWGDLAGQKLQPRLARWFARERLHARARFRAKLRGIIVNARLSPEENRVINEAIRRTELAKSMHVGKSSSWRSLPPALLCFARPTFFVCRATTMSCRASVNAWVLETDGGAPCKGCRNAAQLCCLRPESPAGFLRNQGGANMRLCGHFLFMGLG